MRISGNEPSLTQATHLTHDSSSVSCLKNILEIYQSEYRSCLTNLSSITTHAIQLLVYALNRNILIRLDIDPNIPCNDTEQKGYNG